MSLIRCEIHDETYDSDFVESCRHCERCTDDELETLVSEHEAKWMMEAGNAVAQNAG